jgi:GT2 family glycosyltransferase
MPSNASSPRVTVVVITRDRREEVLASLGMLLTLPERPAVVLVDNASTDGTADAVRRAHPKVEVLELAENLGAAARTVGARRARTPYVAFSDDDSWWDPGALDEAARVLDRVPRVAVVAARVLVGRAGRLDPVCSLMADSPLGAVTGAGPRVLGFVACGAVVRRSAYLDVGGFHRRFGVGGEEALLAIDLAERGWACAYVPSVVARHHPSPVRDAHGRRVRELRNELWTLWLRRRLPTVLRGTLRHVGRVTTDASRRAALREAAGGWRWVRQEREAVGAATETDLRRLRAA